MIEKFVLVQYYKKLSFISVSQSWCNLSTFSCGLCLAIYLKGLNYV